MKACKSCYYVNKKGLTFFVKPRVHRKIIVEVK